MANPSEPRVATIERVLCIKKPGKWSPDPDSLYGETVPTGGLIYTVRRVERGTIWETVNGKLTGKFEFCDDFQGLLLEEIVNQPHQYPDGFKECSFSSRVFRPIDDPGFLMLARFLADPRAPIGDDEPMRSRIKPRRQRAKPIQRESAL
jgi:hypothetical protein